MAVEDVSRFVAPSTPAGDDEQAEVDRLAGLLGRHLANARKEIDAVHVHGAGSGRVQEVVARLLTIELGFRQERRLSLLTTAARPDFSLDLPAGGGAARGVLAEVERGGTTTNNHDLKDLWKTHVAPDAHHLFLVVPHSNWRQDGTPRERPYGSTVRRIGTFFAEGQREIDVQSVHVFGYGRRP